MFGLFKKKVSAKQMRYDNAEAANKTAAKNEEKVYQALVAIGMPATSRMIAARLGWDSASVTPRMPKLRTTGRVVIKYHKLGLDGHWRNYYEAM